MYYAIVVGLMVAAPLVSVASETGGALPLMALVGKWFVFWAVGVRLLSAGVRQILQPRYTAEQILGIPGDGALLVVRELGFANAAIGAVGVIGLYVPAWVLPGALAGGIFYGLAGINHALGGARNRLQTVAMVTDLLAAAVLLGYCAWAVSRGG